ncbi:uncharacterized protein LOC117646326 [Thrips palmi]|uniref:Uncharacterized protein LOC117646326 n=1 Tax=Thrips palmi TaxID=161013 RepID=A0A6P8YST1_THRPL|nr:uncharacterized protein LOC117646326 [Thrips palmi]
MNQQQRRRAQAKQAEEAKHVEQAKKVEQAKTVEQAKNVEQVKDAKQAEQAKNVEQTKQVEQAKPVEQAKVVEQANARRHHDDMREKDGDAAGAAGAARAPPSLASFKVFLFFFFAGIGALVPFLPLHMRAAGLTAREARVVSAAAPLTGLLGPLVAAALLHRRRRARADDEESKKKKRKDAAEDAAPLTAPDKPPRDEEAEAADEARKVRFLLAFTVLGAAVCYSALLLLPSVTWFPARRPSVSFSCNGSGAAVLQERCMEPACYRWPQQQVGPLYLTHCEYECPDSLTAGSGRQRTRTRGSAAASVAADADDRLPRLRTMPVEPPHICGPDGPGGASPSSRTCHVFTVNDSGITIKASLQHATNPDADQSQWCHYPIAESFSCALPSPLTPACRVLCDIEHPYTAEGSVLAQSQCQVLVGDPVFTFWSYLGVRCLADAFPTAALAMVDTALVVATRERAGLPRREKADLGRQMAVGLLGTAIAAPLAGYLSPYPTADPNVPAGWPPYGVPILAFTACMILGAAVLMCSPSMPLGAPASWWEAVRPAGKSPRKSSCEAAALFLVLAMLGAFCSAIDSYLPWHVSGLQREGLGLEQDDVQGPAAWGATPELLVGLNVLAGVLPAVPLLWRSESLIRYCGSSNLLITAFTFYIIRYAGLSLMWSPWWIPLLEATEVFTLSIMWTTAVLAFGALVPRRLLAVAQAVCVAAHFGVGRSLGALLGGLLSRDALPPDDEQDTAPPDDPQLQQLRPLYAAGAGAAAVVAVLYFVLYHCCLQGGDPGKARKKRKALLADRSVLAGHNVNGSYTPLRVYHNGHGRGQGAASTASADDAGL